MEAHYKRRSKHKGLKERSLGVLSSAGKKSVKLAGFGDALDIPEKIQDPEVEKGEIGVDVAKIIGRLVITLGASRYRALRLLGHFLGLKRIYDYPEWRSVRQAVLERDNYTCQECLQKGGELHAHHIIPLIKGGAPFSKQNLMTLCRECHQELHASGITYKSAFRRFVSRAVKLVVS